MITALLKPAPADLVPRVLLAHQHLHDDSAHLGLPPTLSTAAYLNLLLDQIRLWHLADLSQQAALRMLDVYRDRYPTGWQSIGRAAEVQRLGIATEFIVARRMAYDDPWRAALEAHTPPPDARAFPNAVLKKTGPALAWVRALTHDYECRQADLQDYLLSRGLEVFHFLKPSA